MIVAAAIVMTSRTVAADDNSTTPPGNPSSSHGDIDHTQVERAEPGKEWWRDVVARFPNCATLTDGCQSCVPDADTLTCSNPGVACTRTEWRCSAEKPQQPPSKDEKPAPKL